MNFNLPQELLNPYEKKRKPISKDTRKIIKQKCNGRCAYCGIVLNDKFHIDHVLPFYRGGDCDIDNYLPSCARCNNYKLTCTIEEFRKVIERQLELAHKYSVNYRTALRFGMVQEIIKPIVFYFETLPSCNIKQGTKP